MAISDIRQRGILRGIDPAPRRPMHKQQVHIYDATVIPPPVSQSNLNPSGVAPYPTDTEQEPPVVLPKSILLLHPSPADGEQLSATDAEAVMELLVDAAGKVRSAKVLNGADSRWVQASGGWHFIPALHDGIPVACRFRFSIWDRK
jgi:hypothetical protein